MCIRDRGATDALPLDGRPAATRYVEGLVPDGATVLARYEHPHFGQWAAVTTRVVGTGRVTCVGAVSYTHLRAHETVLDLVCRLLLEKKKNEDHPTNS